MRMAEGNMSNRILILGASGFIGNTIYKELLSYFDVYGTFASQEGLYRHNQVFYKYIVEEGDLGIILRKVRPSVIISAFKGNFDDVYKAHELLCEYCLSSGAKLMFLSSADVFDAKGKFPSYESDLPLAESVEGKHKLNLEKLIRNLPEKSFTILRLPLVLGVNSPSIFMLKQSLKHHAAFEVYPHLVLSATTSDKIAQQIHYIINHDLNGIYHLASEDVIHHDDLFKEISERISDQSPIFKSVYSSNEDKFVAILPKENKLPKNYSITIAEVIDESTLKDEIVTFKN
jgi:dTDP-4-dehydrorhamnose reductase